MTRSIIPGQAEAAILPCQQGLSFWGGVNAETGLIIDRHHPLAGQSVSGKVLAMPTSRGSCTGSGVLLELIRLEAGYIIEAETLEPALFTRSSRWASGEQVGTYGLT